MDHPRKEAPRPRLHPWSGQKLNFNLNPQNKPRAWPNYTLAAVSVQACACLMEAAMHHDNLTNNHPIYSQHWPGFPPEKPLEPRVVTLPSRPINEGGPDMSAVEKTVARSEQGKSAFKLTQFTGKRGAS
jgi:hypothetical protein